MSVVQESPPNAPVGPALEIKTISDIEPLDGQFGVDAPLSVPAELRTVLFGQREPSKAEIAQHGGDPGAVPSLKTYAILDAAKVEGLAEQLEASGLAHRCLFKGEAFDELKDVAPWIMRLEDGARFTRNLFTNGEAAWQLWHRDPGIFIRSRADLDQLWAHFRKFTKVQDEDGNWFYLRFWEPGSTECYFSAIQQDAERIGQWFYPDQDQTIEVLTLDPKRAMLTVFQSVDGRPSNRPFRLDQREHKAFQQHQWAGFLVRLADYLSDQDPRFAALSPEEKIKQSQGFAHQSYRYKITTERAVADLSLALMLGDRRVEADPICQRILASSAHQLDKASAVLNEVQQRLRAPR